MLLNAKKQDVLVIFVLTKGLFSSVFNFTSLNFKANHIVGNQMKSTVLLAFPSEIK